MRVTFELLGLVSRQMGGVASYVENLFTEFVRSGQPEELRIWVGRELEMQFLGNPRVTEHNADNLLPGWLSRLRYGRSMLQWLSVTLDRNYWLPDVIHCTMSFPRPAWVGRGMVLTVHDLHFLNQPEAFGHRLSRIMAAHCRIGVRRASRIIAISNHVKQDLVDKFGCSPGKIDVTYHGVDHTRFKPADNADELLSFRQRWKLPYTYLLYPANTWPHKNHPRLIQALAILRDRYRLDCPVVLTGSRKWGEPELAEAIQKHGLGDRVIRLGFVPEIELARCYQAAAALVFPSLHEGFGLPILEAMACGCPVACSRTTSVGEVAGSAAETFDPEDPEAIAAAAARIIEDSARRAALVQAGLSRASEFTWQQTAQATNRSYRRAAEQQAPHTRSSCP